MIGAGTSLLGGLFGSSAAKKAAEAQAKAAQQASDLAGQAGRDAGQTIRNYEPYQNAAYDRANATLDPYLAAGRTGLDRLSTLNFTAPADFVAPTDVTMQNDPGYMFRLQQGQQAIERSAAARGGLFSGGTGKAVQRYGQDLASSEYGNVYDRALKSYQTNLGKNLAGFDANLRGGTALVGAGQFGANETGVNERSRANTLGQNAGEQAGILTGTAANQGNYLTQAGNARGSGYIGASNAWNSALGQIGNAAQLIPLYNSMQQRNPGSSAPSYYGSIPYNPNAFGPASQGGMGPV